MGKCVTVVLVPINEAARFNRVSPTAAAKMFARAGLRPAARTLGGRSLFTLADVKRIAAERAARLAERERRRQQRGRRP